MEEMGEALHIEVNGSPRDYRSGSTVADLLRELEIKTDRIAVELNMEILDRADFELRSLKPGDRVEILSFIGGGAFLIGGQERGRSDV
jgi:sulfur carrier protein